MSRENWGGDNELWGPDHELWGFFGGIIDLDTAPMIAVIVDVDFLTAQPEDFHVCTFDTNVEIDGVTYIGVGPAFSIGQMPANEQDDDTRMEISIGGIPQELRPHLIRTEGLIDVRIRYIYSTDGGNVWLPIPRSIRGYVSNPALSGDTYTFELATDVSTVDRGSPRLFSDGFQKTLFPNDRCFEHLVELADGVGDIGWPPQ